MTEVVAMSAVSFREKFKWPLLLTQTPQGGALLLDTASLKRGFQTLLDNPTEAFKLPCVSSQAVLILTALNTNIVSQPSASCTDKQGTL